MHAGFYDRDGLEDDLVNRVVAAIMKRTELTFNEKKQIGTDTYFLGIKVNLKIILFQS